MMRENASLNFGRYDYTDTRSGGEAAGLRSDGELVQAVSEKTGADADSFHFATGTTARRDGGADHDHKDWIDLLSTGGGNAATDGGTAPFDDAGLAPVQPDLLGDEGGAYPGMPVMGCDDLF